jgi:hypothetical protein
LVLGYDSADTLEQSVAERIVVNAKEAGISLVSRAMPNSQVADARARGAATHGDAIQVDARLIRLRMPSPMPRVALKAFIETLAPMTGVDDIALPENASAEDIYNGERSVINGGRVAPLVWMPQVYGLSARVRDWKQPAAGETWPLADVWLDSTTDAH